MKKNWTKKERAYKKYKALGKKVDDLKASGVERAWLSPEGEEYHEHYSHCCRVGVFFFPDYRHSIGYKCMTGKIKSSIAKKERHSLHMAEVAAETVSFQDEIRAYTKAQEILLDASIALQEAISKAISQMEKADNLRIVKGYEFANHLDEDMADLISISEDLEDLVGNMLDEDLNI
jgi:hypothetical protein